VNQNISTKKPQLWSRGTAFLRESLRDHDIDYTSGRIGRALGLLAIPMMLEMSAVGGLIIAFGSSVAAMFSDDPEVIRYGTHCLRILGLGFPLSAIGIIISQAFNGAGDTTTPTVINLVCFWLIQIPLAYWLAKGIDFGPNGAFVAMVVAEGLLTAMSVVLFRRGNWKITTA